MATGRLAGKRALVTGAGTGIGKGIALEFAKEGAAVALHYSKSPADPVVHEIEAAGGKAKAFQADFRQMEPVQQLATEAVEFLGGLDILVNNAGITFNEPYGQITQEQFDTLYSVNVRAGFFLGQYVLPHLIDSGDAAIINLTSVHGYAGMTEHAIYAGTKGAIIAETRVMAIELGQKGVRVNAIAPGWVAVEGHDLVRGHAIDLEEAGEGQPCGFVGLPKDIGRLAVFLASEDARYFCGQTFICDGGMLAVMPLTGDFTEPRADKFGRRYVGDNT